MDTPASLECIMRDLARAGLRTRPLLCEEDLHAFPVQRGAYTLLVETKQDVRLDRPCNAPNTLSNGTLPPGWYVYAGSARGPGGIPARLARHFRTNKPKHWHIDQLTAVSGANIMAIPVPEGMECDLVAKLIRSGLFHTPCPGFGSSDCRKCEAHLLVWKPGV